MKRNSKSYQMIRRSKVSVTLSYIYNVVKEEVRYTQKCHYRIPMCRFKYLRTVKRTLLLSEFYQSKLTKQTGEFVCTELSNRQR